ncbi:MAG: CPBP family intramembrane metalloprotease [Treponema sp.]|nr:CPBP family intramembrane metalloprotease [Treponema sp.]
MNAFLEPLILYAVLFFRFFAGPVMPETPVEFSASAEVARLVLQTGPSLALVWYLMLKAKSLKEWGVARPGKKDLIPALVSFASIALVGFAVAAAFRHFGEPGTPRIVVPVAVVPWAILVVSVFAGAYLEESFFRLYLLSKRTEMGLGPGRAIFVSTALFAFCHTHLGPWGFLNAAVSGTVLAFVFLRTRSLHGVSFAHGLYNVLVFALGAA